MVSELEAIRSLDPITDADVTDWRDSPAAEATFQRSVDMANSLPTSPPVKSRVRGWIVAVGIAALGLFIALPTLLGNSPQESSSTSLAPASTAVPTAELLFDAGLPWALIVDDGLTGATIVDLTGGATTTMELEGQRAGDQPYRLELVGDHLVVGWREIYAIDLVSGESGLLDEATYFVPSAAPNQVWLINYSGGSVGSGSLTAQRVDVRGDLVGGPSEVNVDGIPEIGIPRGLALESDPGISLWDTATQSETGHLGTDNAYVSDVTTGPPHLLAWCEGSCADMHVTDLTSGQDRIVRDDRRGERLSDPRRSLLSRWPIPRHPDERPCAGRRPRNWNHRNPAHKPSGSDNAPMGSGWTPTLCGHGVVVQRPLHHVFQLRN